jgi:hypothetical protein
MLISHIYIIFVVIGFVELIPFNLKWFEYPIFQ